MELTDKPAATDEATTATRNYGRQVDEDAPSAERPPRCFYGWAVWLVLCIGNISTFFGTSSAITFVIDPVMEELSLSRSAISAVYMAGTLLGAAAQIPIGRAVDKYGGRRSITVCAAAFAASCSCLSLPHHWATLLLAFGFLRALGFGGLALACTTTLQQWFARRRGLATGMMEAANSLVGFGACSSLLHALIEAYGWRGAYLRSGIALMAFVPVAALVIRSRPEEIGLRPDGDPHVAADGGTRQSSGGAGGAGGGGSAVGGATPPVVVVIEGWRLGEATRTGAFWLIVLSNALAWGVGAGIFIHLASISRELGLPVSRLPSCFYLPWAMSRAAALLVGGALLDRTPPRFVLGAGFVSGGASLAWLGWPGAVLTPSKTVLAGMLYGLSMGLSKAAFAICPARFFGRAHLGAIQGVLQTTNVASTAVGPLVIGVAHDAGASYSSVLLGIAVATACFGVVSLLLLQAPQRRPARASLAEVTPEPVRIVTGKSMEPERLRV